MLFLKLASSLFLGLIAVSDAVAISPAPKILASGRQVTTGVPTRAGEGYPYIRREINDLKKNHPEGWTLFLLGLAAFQELDQNDPLSYYRISGIHGKPNVVWQDAQGAENPGGGGYCPHNNVMFGVWHRPYVALFEQELFKHVRKIADQYTIDQRRWTMAADAFRLPYWDWALGEQGGEFPDIFTTTLATVIGTDGNLQTIPNPLYQHRFHPVSSSDFDSPWAQMNKTLRCPTSHAPDAESQPQQVRAHYLTYRRGIHDAVAHAFTIEKYNKFASDLESPHGSVHFLAGCMDPYAGHFWNSDYSAFDPIFMLVHANVDRLIAMYQAIHPYTWLEPSNCENTGNFWIPNNSQLTASTQMPPFWKDDQSFYTPNEIRNISVLGYAYPETQYWNFPTLEQWQLSVNSTIAYRYSSSARDKLTQRNAKGDAGLSHLLTDGTFNDWTVKSKVSLSKLPSTFYVVFSFRNASSSDAGYEVGAWTRQRTGQPDTTHATQQEPKRTDYTQSDAENTMSLTSSLLDRISAGDLKSLDAKDVVPYLKAHLTWQVKTGNVLHLQSADDVAIEVSSSKVRIPDDPSRMLEYSSESTAYPEATSRL